MAKKTDQTRSKGRQGKVPADLKTPSKAAIRSRQYRLNAEKDRLKQFNLMAPADQDSRALVREIAVHLAPLGDEIAIERRAQIRAILSSPAAHEPLPITGADAALVAEQKQVPVATPARKPDPIAEALKRELTRRQDAWPILLRILRDKQLLADSQLAAKRPDGIKFLRGLIKTDPLEKRRWRPREIHQLWILVSAQRRARTNDVGHSTATLARAVAMRSRSETCCNTARN